MTHAGRGLQALPVAAWPVAESIIGREDPAYHVQGLTARNPAQRLDLRFAPTGVTVRSGNTRGSLALAAVGRAGLMRAVTPAVPRASENRVTYARPGLSEWYVNGPFGLEQGVDLARRPAGPGSLSLVVQVSGALRPRVAHGAVVFGRSGLRYSGLQVTDARKRAVPAWLSSSRGRVVIHVEDARATYPLHVDPFVQQAMLTPSDASPSDYFPSYFGGSVALSADGNTALIGGSGDDGNGGAAWVFTRSGSVWSQQGPKLSVSETGSQAEEFGSSVALSADGNTALIGAPTGPNIDGPVGAAWVFTRSGSVWSQQGGKLTPSDEAGYADFGATVALSGDGNTALIGGYGDNDGLGAAWVFTRTGSTWSQQGAKLTPSDAASSYYYPTGFGDRVSLSADGNTALIGGGDDNTQRGAAWIFTRSGSVWAQQGAKLTASDESGPIEFGFTVSLSADASTALIGSYDDAGPGGAWVFTRSGSVWTQQGGKLLPSGNSVSFGSSVSLSSQGNTALIGGGGAVWVFTRSGSAWAEQGGQLTYSDESDGTPSSASVALSSDASTALIGTNQKNGKVGAAWVFSSSPGGGGPGGSGPGGGGGSVKPGSLRVKITKEKISRKHHRAQFAFKSAGSTRATSFQCALVKPPEKTGKHGKKTAKPHFTRCRSAKSYNHLPKGKYTFEVRPLAGSLIGTAVKRAFTI